MGGGSELGSGSGSKDTNPDPAKWCGFLDTDPQHCFKGVSHLAFCAKIKQNFKSPLFCT